MLFLTSNREVKALKAMEADGTRLLLKEDMKSPETMHRSGTNTTSK